MRDKSKKDKEKGQKQNTDKQQQKAKKNWRNNPKEPLDGSGSYALTDSYGSCR